MTNEADYKIAGARRSILCATLGLAMALTLIFLTFNVGSEPLTMLAPVISGTIGLYVGAYFYGRLAGKFAYRAGIGSYKVWFIGVPLAWSCVMTMALAGSSFFFLKELDPSNVYETLRSYVFLPVVWIAAWGWIPALILGLIWAKQMKKRFKVSA